MARLEISLLGAFRVELNGSPVSDFGTEKTRALLAYVCVEASRAHRRDALAGLLWPEQADDAALRNLRQALHKLRQVLNIPQEGPELAKEGAPDLLRVTAHDVQLDPDSDYRLDVEAFTNLTTASRTHRHRKAEQCTTCHERLRQAAELYRGDFLAGFFLVDTQAFDEWLALKREGLKRLALEAFSRLATYCETHSEYEPALQYAHRRLELEPWREEAHRQVMRLLALTGERTSALAQYETCRQVLAAVLNAEPSAETNALYERILRGSETGTAADSDRPPLRSYPSTPNPHRHNLPGQLTPFIGRTDELERIIERLDSPDSSLITLMGPGGAGKTRLALQAASRQVGAFDDGVYWVPLSSINSPPLLATSIGQAIGLHFEASENPQTQLVNYLSGKEMLLLLDNFEHLLAGAEAVELLLSILRSAPEINILVTSRERLGLQAEYLLDLSGLALPSNDPGPTRERGEGFRDPSELMAYDAVQLFVERARQANPDFALSPDTAQAVIDICRLVAGLPLGIVLAAAWVRHFSPAKITASIKANLDFLASSSPDAAPQHASLRAAFNHSWNLLSDDETQVFRRLSVFRGGWEEEAAVKVAAASLRSLVSLVDKSLLRQDAPGRFNTHDLLRQYAAEKLSEVPDEQYRTKSLHAAYYLELAEAAEAGLKSDEQDKLLDRLEREHGNLRAALGWARDSEELEIGLRLAGALSQFWFVRGHFSEGREALAAVLSSLMGPDNSVETAPPITASSQSERAEPQRPLEAFRARALRAAGDLDRSQGDYAGARVRYAESLAIYRELGDKKNIAIALVRLAIAHWNPEDLGLARSLYEEALVLTRELGDRKDIALTVGDLGLLAFVEGDYSTARSLLEESVELIRELGDKFNLAIRLNNLGNVALMQGDHTGARPLHAEALVLRRELGDKWGIAISLVGLGAAAISAGDVERGTRLLGAAEALLNAAGAILEFDDRIPYEHAVASARGQLSEEVFARVWVEGHAMPMEQAIAYAMEDT